MYEHTRPPYATGAGLCYDFFMKKLMRILLYLATAAYALVLVYVLFFWSTAIGYESGWHSLNLRPLAEVASAYFSDDGLVRSQFMLNILLFVPFGFLLPLLFPRAAGAFWKTALMTLAFTLAAETVQYFIGRSADIDDVIANLLGGMAGYACFTLAQALFGRLAFFRALSKSERRVKPLCAVAAVLGLLLIFGTPFALDALDAKNQYGLFRYVSMPIPVSASVTCDMDGIALTGTVYEKRTGLEEETANRLLAAFPAPEGAVREAFTCDEERGGKGVSVTVQDGSYRSTVYGDGSYNITFKTAEGAYPDDAEGFGAWVQSVLPRLAPEGVTLVLADVSVQGAEVSAGAEDGAPASAGDRSISAWVRAEVANGELLVNGSLHFTYTSGSLWISSSLVLADPGDSVKTISAADALKAARSLTAYPSFYTNIEITGVSLTVREVRGLFLPCYAFTGTAKHEGESVSFTSMVDAVER